MPSRCDAGGNRRKGIQLQCMKKQSDSTRVSRATAHRPKSAPILLVRVTVCGLFLSRMVVTGVLQARSADTFEGYVASNLLYHVLSGRLLLHSERVRMRSNALARWKDSQFCVFPAISCSDVSSPLLLSLSFYPMLPVCSSFYEVETLKVSGKLDIIVFRVA